LPRKQLMKRRMREQRLLKNKLALMVDSVNVHREVQLNKNKKLLGLKEKNLERKLLESGRKSRLRRRQPSRRQLRFKQS